MENFVHASVVLCTLSPIIHRKYIPADTDRVEGDCSKAFVDVFSESIESPGAFVCCNDDSQQNGYDICMPPVSQNSKPVQFDALIF